MKLTIRDFANALGLGTSRDKITHAGIILKTISEKGLAPIVGKIPGDNGRPPLVYDLDPKVAAVLGIKETDVRQLDYKASEVLKMTNRIRKSLGLKPLGWHVFRMKLQRLRKSHKGKNNPYKEKHTRGKARFFSPHSAFIISGELSSNLSDQRMRSSC